MCKSVQGTTSDALANAAVQTLMCVGITEPQIAESGKRRVENLFLLKI